MNNHSSSLSDLIEGFSLVAICSKPICFVGGNYRVRRCFCSVNQLSLQRPEML